MNKLFYPAIFHIADEGGFWVSFPDFPECFSEGETMEHAYDMAFEALGLAITELEKENLSIPLASDPSQISLDANSFIVVIQFDLLAYKKRTSPRAVKKTLSIPEWMNEEAMALGINFSQVLQEALLLKIQSVK